MEAAEVDDPRLLTTLKKHRIVIPKSFGETDRSPKRKELPIPFVKAFEIERFITLAECKILLEESKRVGFSSLATEYPAVYRSNFRTLVKSPALADKLWSHLRAHLQKKDVVGVRPYGFDNDGDWFPKGINEVFKFNKYRVPAFNGAPERFAPHRDGVFVRNNDERSVYTLLLYLNDRYVGGSTNFIHPKCKAIMEVLDDCFGGHALTKDVFKFLENEGRPYDFIPTLQAASEPNNFGTTTPPAGLMEGYSNLGNWKHFTAKFIPFFENNIYMYTPKAGSLLVFNHDALHEGAPLTNASPSPKYVIKTELMFQRLKPRGNEFKSTPIYQKAVELYHLSNELEKQGKLDESLKCYLEAQEMQLLMPTLSSNSSEASTFGDLNRDALVLILQNMLTLSEVAKCALVCKHWSTVTRDPELWFRLFSSYYPHLSQFELSSFKARVDFENETPPVVFDLGTDSIKTHPPETAHITNPHSTIRDSRVIVGEELYKRTLGLRITNVFSVSDEGRVSFGSNIDAVVSHAYRQLERAEEEVPLVISCKPKGKLGGKFFGDPSYFAHVVVCEALGLSYVPLLMVVEEPILALAAHGQKSGIVVMCGHTFTYVVAVIDEVTVEGSVSELSINGFKLFAAHLRPLGIMGPTYRKRNDERATYVKAAFINPSPGVIDPAKALALPMTAAASERFFLEEPTPETPFPVGLPYSIIGLQGAIMATVARCPSERHNQLLNSIVLCGGTSNMKNFKVRLEAELALLMPKAFPEKTFTVLQSEQPEFDIANGGKVFASTSQFFERAVRFCYESELPQVDNFPPPEGFEPVTVEQ